MGAPINNKNSEKWNLDKTRELAELAYNTVSDDCYFISEVADRCDVYRELFFYVLQKFNDDEVVFNTIKKMANKCEMIVAKKTAAGDIVPSLGIFILKSYHGLTETSKQEIKHEGSAITIQVGSNKAKDGLDDLAGEVHE